MTSKINIHLLFSLILTIPTLIFITPFSHAQHVSVTIGSGSGAPGSKNNPVVVTLDNSIRLKGFQLAIKDNKDYLTAVGGGAIGRTTGLDLEIHEQTYGWTILHFYSFFGGKIIEEGSGPVATINFDVKRSAPPGECIALRVLEKGRDTTSKYQDEDGGSFPIASVPGRFCFTEASEDDDEEEEEEEEDDSSTTSSTSDNSGTLTEDSATNISSNRGVSSSQLSSNKIRSSIAGGTNQLTYGTPRKTTPATITSPASSERKESTRSTQESAVRSLSVANTGGPDSDSSLTRLVVSPETVTLTSGDMIALDPQTINGGIEVEGNYSYEIIPPSPIGSTIDDEGLFTAGTNTSPANIEETIKVTDTSHENATAFVVIIVAVRKQPSAECELSISPSSVTLSPDDFITFSAKTHGKTCSDGLFEWKVNSTIGSSISEEGIYKAGTNTSSDPVLDIIIVTDSVNKVSTDALVTVISTAKVASGVSTGSTSASQVSVWQTYPKILIFLTIFTIFIGIIFFRKIRY